MPVRMKINLKNFHLFKKPNLLDRVKNIFSRIFGQKKQPPKTLLQKALVLSLALVVIGLLILSGLKLFVAGFVNNRPISRIWLDRELERRVGQRLMDAEIGKILVEQEAKKQGIRITDADVKQRADAFKNEVESQGSKFDEFLTFQGITQDEFEDEVRLQMMVEKILTTRVTVTDEEAQKYFEENASFFEKGATFESSKELAKDAVFQQKISEMYQTWIEELKAKARIKYLINFQPS